MMNTTRTLLSVAILAFLIASGDASAGKNAPTKDFVFTNVAASIQQPVEQQSPNFFFCGGSQGPVYCPFDESTWVTNPTSCAWDVDDYISYSGDGIVRGNTSESVTLCVIEDGFNNYQGDAHPVAVYVSAPASALTVTINSTVISGSPSGNRVVYQGCVLDPTSGPYPVVDGSNGGTGIVTYFTLTLTNARKTDVRDVSVIFQVSAYGVGAFWLPCP